MSLNKILVPTDLSEAGTRVLAEARIFAAAFSATIDLMYVWTPPALAAPESVLTGVGVAEQPLLEWLRANASEMLSKFESDARSAGIPVRESFCDLGDPATAIVERAASGGYDLLVLGTQGRTGLSHVLMGSVAEKVVRRAPCPVLTVRAKNPTEEGDPSPH
jgi:nucleotide-binding universal stress UspA family protein